MTTRPTPSARSAPLPAPDTAAASLAEAALLQVLVTQLLPRALHPVCRPTPSDHNQLQQQDPLARSAFVCSTPACVYARVVCSGAAPPCHGARLASAAQAVPPTACWCRATSRDPLPAQLSAAAATPLRPVVAARAALSPCRCALPGCYMTIACSEAGRQMIYSRRMAELQWTVCNSVTTVACSYI
jgi:hypothetical protein